MTRTEYTRQVPIKHWLPIAKNTFEDSVKIGVQLVGNVALKEETTGYKQQRAWLQEQGGWVPHIEPYEIERLARGEDVKNFVWLDEPVKE